MIFFIINSLNSISIKTKTIIFSLNNDFIFKTSFLSSFYKKNDLIWQEGLLLDFLQKKSFDVFTKKFLIYSSYLVNEKLFFDKIVKFFINLIILPFQHYFIFENFNISNLFFFIILFFFFFFFSISIFLLFQFF